MNKKLKAGLTGTLLAASCLLNVANAGIIQQTYEFNNDPTGFPVSNSDLISNMLALVDGSLLLGWEGTSTNVGILTDGAFGSAFFGGYSANQETLGVGNNTSFTYSLDTVANPLGYIINSIDSFVGWRDAGRDNQNYEILFSYVNDPNTFIHLASINYSAPGSNASPANTKVSINDDTGVIGTGVSSIRFMFTNTENGYIGLRELDIHGSAILAQNTGNTGSTANVQDVPEPSTLAIFGLGLMGLVSRRFKKQ